MQLRLARHPQRLDSKHEILIEDLLVLAAKGQHGGLSAIIEMLTDLHQNGHRSRFARSLKGLPLLELKTTRRGGQKGGARVYFFYARGEAILIGCEIKEGGKASVGKLEEALEVLVGYQNGVEVVKGEED